MVVELNRREYWGCGCMLGCEEVLGVFVGTAGMCFKWEAVSEDEGTLGLQGWMGVHVRGILGCEGLYRGVRV